MELKQGFIVLDFFRKKNTPLGLKGTIERLVAFVLADIVRTTAFFGLLCLHYSGFIDDLISKHKEGESYLVVNGFNLINNVGKIWLMSHILIWGQKPLLDVRVQLSWTTKYGKALVTYSGYPYKKVDLWDKSSIEKYFLRCFLKFQEKNCYNYYQLTDLNNDVVSFRIYIFLHGSHK